MAAAQYAVVAAVLSEPAVIGAIIAAAAAVIVRAVPKTRSEAGVDRSVERLNSAQEWALLIKTTREANDVLQEDIKTLRERVEQAESALLAEREECDRQMRGLLERIVVLEAARPQRVFFRE